MDTYTASQLPPLTAFTDVQGNTHWKDLVNGVVYDLNDDGTYSVFYGGPAVLVAQSSGMSVPLIIGGLALLYFATRRG